MPSPERGGSPPDDASASSHEREPLPFAIAARFLTEPEAFRAYGRAHRLVFGRADAALSVFRFPLENRPHVAVIGETPANDLESQLRRILNRGLPVTLSPDILGRLRRRREEAAQEGEWVERHFRPGEPIP